MALSENGSGMVMPVGPVYGNGDNGWFGEGGLFWIIILFLFGWMGNGWGGNNQGTVNSVNNDLQRGFDQQAIMGNFGDISSSMNNLAMSLQNACCENRAGIADLKYTIATEACADRNAVSTALNSLENSLSAKSQFILDKMCQLELDSYKTKVSDLQSQLNISALRESQTDQTARVLADNAAQTAVLRQALNPTPIPAYVVQNPNGCGQTFYGGCGCGA